MKILHAEDDEVLRTLAARSVPDPHRLVVANDGQFALDYLLAGEDAEEVDVVVTDYQMPRMTGFQLLVRIRLTTRLRHLPVVIVSGGADEDLIQVVKEYGGIFIPKPFSWKNLLLMLENLVRSK